MSSGVFVKDYYMDAYCRKCLFEGEALVFVDSEEQCWYWDCPMCGHEWGSEGVPRMEGY
jgi:hypothetical protein